VRHIALDRSGGGGAQQAFDPCDQLRERRSLQIVEETQHFGRGQFAEERVEGVAGLR
jgi:hypothetical protein